jgi:hypothetical protein
MVPLFKFVMSDATDLSEELRRLSEVACDLGVIGPS